MLPRADSACFARSWCRVFRPWIFVGTRGTEETLKKELAVIKNQLTAIKERSMEVRQG
jgi:hypothetical protein